MVLEESDHSIHFRTSNNGNTCPELVEQIRGSPRLAMSANGPDDTTGPSDVSARGDQLPQLAMVELEVCGLNGELVRMKLPAVCTGKEVRKVVAEKLPSRPGAKFLLYHGNSQVMLDRTLREQGIVGHQATLTYTLAQRTYVLHGPLSQERQGKKTHLH